MPSLRPSRNLSRTSTPSLNPLKYDSSPAEEPRKENRKTLLDKWVEPPVKQQVPAFEEYGFQRAGLFSQMAPLGQMPPTKLKIRLSSGQGVKRKSGLSKGELLSAMDTPAETPEGTPPNEVMAPGEEWVANSPNLAVIPSKEEVYDEDYLPKKSKTPTQRQAAGVNGHTAAPQPPPSVSTPKQSRRGSLSFATPHSVQTLNSPRSTNMSSTARSSYTRQEWDGIVEGVVAAATRAGKPKVGNVTQLLCREYQNDPQIQEVLDAIMQQTATSEQYSQFKDIYRRARKQFKETQRSAKKLSRMVNGSGPSNKTTALLPAFSEEQQPPPRNNNHSNNAIEYQSNNRRSSRRNTNISPSTGSLKTPSSSSSQNRSSRHSLPATSSTQPTSFPRLTLVHKSKPTSIPDSAGDMRLRNREYASPPAQADPGVKRQRKAKPTAVPATKAKQESGAEEVDPAAATSLGSSTTLSVPDPKATSPSPSSLPLPSKVAVTGETAAKSRPRRGAAQESKSTTASSAEPTGQASTSTSITTGKQGADLSQTGASAVPSSSKITRVQSSEGDDSLSDVDEKLIEKLETEQTGPQSALKPVKASTSDPASAELSEDPTAVGATNKKKNNKKPAKKQTKVDLTEEVIPVQTEAQAAKEAELEKTLASTLRDQSIAAGNSQIDPGPAPRVIDGDFETYTEATRPNYRAVTPMRRQSLDEELMKVAPPLFHDRASNKRTREASDNEELTEYETDNERGNKVRRSTRGDLAAQAPPTKRQRAETGGATTKMSPVKAAKVYAGVPPLPAFGGPSEVIGGDGHDNCDACGGDGNLVVCDSCENAFHTYCLDPPIEPGDEDFLNKPFHCEPCKFEAKEAAKVSADSRRVDFADENEESLEGMPDWLGVVNKAIERTNVRAFSLPKQVQNYFMGVSVVQHGRYRFHTDIPVPLSNKRKAAIGARGKSKEADATATEAEDDQIEFPSIKCTVCGEGDQAGNRPIYECDHDGCDNKIHSDHNKFYHADYELPSKGYRWPILCSRHLGFAVSASGDTTAMFEHNGKAIIQHPIRMLRKGLIMSNEEAHYLNYRNMGNIEVELDETEEDFIARMNAKIIRVPEKEIVRGFFDKGKHRAYDVAAQNTAQKAAEKHFHKHYQDLVNAEFERRVQREIDDRWHRAKAELKDYARELLARPEHERDAAMALHNMSDFIHGQVAQAGQSTKGVVSAAARSRANTTSGRSNIGDDSSRPPSRAALPVNSYGLQKGKGKFVATNGASMAAIASDLLLMGANNISDTPERFGRSRRSGLKTSLVNPSIDAVVANTSDPIDTTSDGMDLISPMTKVHASRVDALTVSEGPVRPASAPPPEILTTSPPPESGAAAAGTFASADATSAINKKRKRGSDSDDDVAVPTNTNNNLLTTDAGSASKKRKSDKEASTTPVGSQNSGAATSSQGSIPEVPEGMRSTRSRSRARH